MAEVILKISLIVLILYIHNIEADENKVLDRYYPRYHLAPPHGWMNDPNGFCYFQNEYHLFYQYNPYSSLGPGIANWGHARSKDLFHWEHLPISMYPDQWYDKTGVFSGSALIENNTMYLYYTGNVNYPGQNPDHVNRQALAISTDGITATKYEKNPIINGIDGQPNLRDPKVWQHGDTYYMVLGNSYNNDTLGRILLYSSKDKIIWNEVSILGQSNGTLGYMWECPDFFELDGKFVLLFSPQGVKPQGDKYNNLYQVGYFVGNFDYSTLVFSPTSDFKELDHGHDFYATQTILDPLGRRIVVSWFDMWERNYPEGKDGFTGCMTVPRELRLSAEGNLIQKPLEENSSIRSTKISGEEGNYTLSDKAGDINIVADNSKDLVVFIESSNVNVSIKYDSSNSQITLDRGSSDGIRRAEWKPQGQLKWRILIDASSIELFCGEGEVTFSSRFFPDGPVSIRSNPQQAIISVYDISRTVPLGSSTVIVPANSTNLNVV